MTHTNRPESLMGLDIHKPVQNEISLLGYIFELGSEIAEAITEEERKAIGRRALSVVDKNRGALDRVVDGIIERI